MPGCTRRLMVFREQASLLQKQRAYRQPGRLPGRLVFAFDFDLDPASNGRAQVLRSGQTGMDGRWRRAHGAGPERGHSEPPYVRGGRLASGRAGSSKSPAVRPEPIAAATKEMDMYTYKIHVAGTKPSRADSLPQWIRYISEDVQAARPASRASFAPTRIAVVSRNAARSRLPQGSALGASECQARTVHSAKPAYQSTAARSNNSQS